MKNKTLFLIGIILALVGYLVIKGIISNNDKKEASERLKQSSQIINTLEKKNDVLDQKNDSLERLYVIDSLQLDSLKKANTIIIASADYHAKKYADLLKETLKDCPDSLQNYQLRETVLLAENKEVKNSNQNLRAQVETLETTLATCKEVNQNYKIIQENDEQIKAEMQRSNDILIADNTKLKKQNTFWKIVSVGAFILGVAL